MAEKVIGRPWTAEEDNLLIQAVTTHGQNDNWKQVALEVPGRTNKACRKVRKRWFGSLTSICNIGFYSKAMASLFVPHC